MSRFEFFPKENPELGDCWALYFYLPFTGSHLFYMKENKKGAFRLGLLGLWLVSPFIMKITSIVWLSYWKYGIVILPAIWLYDGFTLKKLFQSRWGNKLSIRV